MNWVDVVEGENVFVFIDFFGRNFVVNDFVENVVVYFVFCVVFLLILEIFLC